MTRTNPKQSLLHACASLKPQASSLPSRLGILAFILLAVVFSLSVQAAVAPQLREFSSRAYSVHTNLSADEVREFAAHMDSVFAEYQRRFAGFNRRNREPIAMYLLRSQEDYQAFMAQAGLDAKNSGGMFFVQPRISGLATWTADRGRKQTFEVLQHEGFHQFAFAYLGPDLPVWLNEGLAQYFEDGFLTEQGRMVLGMVNYFRLLHVRKALGKEGKTVAFGFEEIIEMTGDRWNNILATDAKRASLLYDQAWSITYFLIHGDDGRYKPAFERFLVMLAKGQPVKSAFGKAFGSEDTEPFRKRWEEWVRTAKADPLTVTVLRMELLGQAMAFMREKKMEIPRSLPELRGVLKGMRFKASRSVNGVTVEFDATDDQAYRYPLNEKGDQTAEFELTLPTPGNAGSPPEITAPGASYRPRLTWTRDGEEKWVAEVVYR